MAEQYQHGGWYNGKQWNAQTKSFGAAGVENVGANTGKAVSAAVVAQTNPNNVGFIQQQQAAPPPTNKDQVTPYLNDYQKGLLSSSQAPQTRVQSPEELKAQLTPTTPLPDALNRAKRFDELRTQYGVSALEEGLNGLKAEQEALIAENRQRVNAQRGQGVAGNVVAGRIGEVERQTQERLDYIGRQISRATDELSTKYNVINLYMGFENLDYQDAVQRYEQEYTRNVQIYEMIAGQQKQARSEFEYDQQAARANLQIYANAITSGNLNAGSMSDDQKLMLNKLEVQSGLPIGFVSSLNLSPKDRLININEKTGEALVVGENGGFQVIQTGFSSGAGTGGGSAKVGSNEYNANIRSTMSSKLSQIANSYGHISPEQWRGALNAYVQDGGTREDFIKNFGQFADVNRGDFQSAYGFGKPQ